MKKQIITFGLLLAALSFTSCKNNETQQSGTPAATIATTAADSTTMKPATTVIDSVKSAEKGENEADEKNEKE